MQDRTKIMDVLDGKHHAHKLRGINHHETAVLFAKAFPVGSTLKPIEFDQWAWNTLGPDGEPLIKNPHTGDKKSDAWKANLQRRHELKSNINKAGLHPRLIEMGIEPFKITPESAGSTWVWYVQNSEDAIIGNKVGKRVEGIAETQRRALIHAAESMSQSEMTPALLAIVRNAVKQADNFVELTNVHCRQIERDFNDAHKSLEEARQLSLPMQPNKMIVV